MYITICGIDYQSKFDACNRALKAGALWQPWGMGWGRCVGGSGWRTHVYPWLIHVNVWQNPLKYCKVISLQLKKKDPNAGKDCKQEKGMIEDETVGWHHWLNGHEFEQAPGNGEGQGSLVCCSPWGCKQSDTIEQLNNNILILRIFLEIRKVLGIILT